MEDLKQFNEWKAQVENINPQTQLDCLRIIEINLSNICNFRCPFCPQSLNYKSSKGFMTLDTVKEITKQMRDCNFKGYICVAGFGEPSLNPQFVEIIEELKDFNTLIITNGTQLDKKIWDYLTTISQIKVSVHHWKDLEWYKEKFKDTNAWYRNHDMENPKINLYNRGGYLGKPVKKIESICYLPFYKVFIDTDGKYLQCEADWEHLSENNLSIWNTKLKDYYLINMDKKRELMLSSNKRQSFKCCQNCDINGQMTGKKFVEFWENDKKRKI